MISRFAYTWIRTLCQGLEPGSRTMTGFSRTVNPYLVYCDNRHYDHSRENISFRCSRNVIKRHIWKRYKMLHRHINYLLKHRASHSSMSWQESDPETDPTALCSTSHPISQWQIYEPTVFTQCIWVLVKRCVYHLPSAENNEPFTECIQNLGSCNNHHMGMRSHFDIHRNRDKVETG